MYRPSPPFREMLQFSIALCFPGPAWMVTSLSRDLSVAKTTLVVFPRMVVPLMLKISWPAWRPEPPNMPDASTCDSIILPSVVATKEIPTLLLGLSLVLVAIVMAAILMIIWCGLEVRSFVFCFFVRSFVVICLLLVFVS